jgi:chlorite dismutase
MPETLLVTFTAGETGRWRIDEIRSVRGETLPLAERLAVGEGPVPGASAAGIWQLRGVTSHLRYTTERERQGLTARQAGLNRPAATRAALIPIRKTAQWWELAQDGRRAIFEERSRHIAIGQDYLPAIARRLHHSRDLGEPFDFLTWFEYAPADAAVFDDMVRRLRDTEEWHYVEREVDIRLTRENEVA